MKEVGKWYSKTGGDDSPSFADKIDQDGDHLGYFVLRLNSGELQFAYRLSADNSCEDYNWIRHDFFSDDEEYIKDDDVHSWLRLPEFI